MNHFHHAHLFAADIEVSLAFYCGVLGGKVVLDVDMAGARNVFVTLGRGRLHFYDQPPHDAGRGAVHHLGIQVDDLEALVEKMKAAGVSFRKPIADFGLWKYIMAPAPDGVLLELFEVDVEQVPDELREYFF
ncbi:MAG: VOC family protein [Candidatus Lernaella stagnicola]|nr:VOC family protein [Candidatus Lernaella stagnicola]